MAGLLSTSVTLTLTSLAFGVHGLHEVNLDYKGNRCINPCSQDYKGGRYAYNFCYTEGSWGYCSPLPEVTSRNRVCRSDHRCGEHGYRYHWCRTQDSSWDYCSPTPLVQEGVQIEDAEGFYCKDECDTRGKSYTWCNNRNTKGWGYCSVSLNIASSGGTCKSDHKCDRHGGTYYNWCYTNEDSSWQYCSNIDGCSWPQKETHPGNWNMVCSTQTNDGKFRNMFAEKGTSFELTNYKRLSNREMISLQDLLDSWPGALSTRTPASLSSNGDWRMENAGRQPSGHLVVRVLRNAPDSPPIAQLIVHETDIRQETFSADFMREAFRRSVERRTTACLALTEDNGPAACPSDGRLGE